MRTEVVITACADGTIVHRAVGALTVRQTGPTTVHLVGTAAGPLDGDTVSVHVSVAAGAHLRVRTVAASVVLAGCSSTAWRLDVAGTLDLAPEPTVVTADAVHRNEVRATLTADAALVLAERVQLGRAGEAPGRWTGALQVDRDGGALLRHEVVLGAGDLLGPATALVSTLRVPDDRPAAVDGAEVRLPLVGGGTLTTEVRARL